MIATLMSELVDTRELEQGHTSERQRELFYNVAALFRLTSQSCTDEQIDVYDSVLFRLAGMVEMEARAQISEMLAPLGRAPGNTLVRLARDEIQVARPILVQSPALSDEDLVWVAETRGQDHLIAIAQRPSLSQAVTDVMVPRGEMPVRLQLAANMGAALSDASYAMLIDDAKRDGDLKARLAKRDDIPDQFIGLLVRHATGEVRKTLADHDQGGEIDKLDRAAAIAQDRMVRDYWRAQYDFDDAWQRVSKLAAHNALDNALIERLAAADRFPETVCAVAIMCMVTLDEALHWMTAADPKPFLTAAKANGLPRKVVEACLTTGPWKRRLSREARNLALSRFDALDIGVARQLFGFRHEGRKAS